MFPIALRKSTNNVVAQQHYPEIGQKILERNLALGMM
jgi:hypothetical protein